MNIKRNLFEWRAPSDALWKEMG